MDADVCSVAAVTSQRIQITAIVILFERRVLARVRLQGLREPNI